MAGASISSRISCSSDTTKTRPPLSPHPPPPPPTSLPACSYGYKNAASSHCFLEATSPLIETSASRIPWVAKLGSTEAGFHGPPTALRTPRSAGCVGLPPRPVVTLKLTPNGPAKWSCGFKSSVRQAIGGRRSHFRCLPNEDGFSATGDALAWAEAGNQQTGFRYDGTPRGGL